MTSLLQDQLGGNCRTHVLVCFSPFTDPSATSELFQLADNLSKVKNFPLLNEAFAQVCNCCFTELVVVCLQIFVEFFLYFSQAVNNYMIMHNICSVIQLSLWHIAKTDRKQHTSF